jgi:hypothetical protein
MSGVLTQSGAKRVARPSSWPRSVHRGRTARLALALFAAGFLVLAASASAWASVPTITRYAGTGAGAAPVPGPATSSPLHNPQGAVLDSSGNLYIVDTLNQRVEKVTPGGTLSIVAGTGAAAAPTPGPATSSALNNPMGVAIGADGTMYIADTSNYEIEKVTPGGTLSVIAGTGVQGHATAGPALQSHIYDPEAVSVDGAGNVYITDTNGNEIEKVTPGGTLSIFAGTGSSGSPTPGPATSSDVNYPEGVAIDSSGNAYIADCTNNVVEKVTPSGTLSIVAGNGSNTAPTYGAAATSSGMKCAFSVAVNSDGTLLITDINNNTIDRVGLATPGPPLQLSASSGTGSAQLTFAAPTDRGTSAITGYEVSLDGGLSWQALATSPAAGGLLTATLSGLTNGATYPVVVRADNSSGAGDNSLTVSVTPSSPATTSSPTTTAVGTTTTTTSAPPVTTTGSGDGVSLSEKTARTGVTVSPTGGVALPLVCPQTATGCDADGLLTLALTGASSHALVADAETPVKDSVLARFAGVEIQSGHGRLVSVKLTPAATRYLQTRGIRRVRVTLTIHNHLSGGPDVTTTQKVWLNIARLEASCPAATGTLTASSIARMRLGLSHGQAHRLGHYRKAGFGFERYCLTGGSIRVKYPAAKLLRSMSQAQRHQDTGQIYLALTANKHYTAGRVHTGMTVNAARRDLRLGAGVTVGKNTWYLVVTKKAAWVLKAQHGTIREIGITSRSLTTTRQARQLLLHNI